MASNDHATKALDRVKVTMTSGVAERAIGRHSAGAPPTDPDPMPGPWRWRLRRLAATRPQMARERGETNHAAFLDEAEAIAFLRMQPLDLREGDRHQRQLGVREMTP